METINLYVKDYTLTPGPRYIRQDVFSGEDFYIKKLNPCFYRCVVEDKRLEIYLDGTAGYPSSFLDEAFGELVYDFSRSEVEKRVVFVTQIFKRHKDRIINETYPQWEKRRNDSEVIFNTPSLKGTRIHHIDNNGNLVERQI